MGFLSSMHIETFTLDSFTFYLIPYLYQLVSILLINYRVLCRIYRLGEKSQVAEGQELPRGARGHATPEIFWNEYALRCNLVHFETQFWEMCTDLVASGWFFRYSYLYTVMITIFLGGKLGIYNIILKGVLFTSLIGFLGLPCLIFFYTLYVYVCLCGKMIINKQTNKLTTKLCTFWGDIVVPL